MPKSASQGSVVHPKESYTYEEKKKNADKKQEKKYLFGRKKSFSSQLGGKPCSKPLVWQCPTHRWRKIGPGCYPESLFTPRPSFCLDNNAYKRFLENNIGHHSLTHTHTHTHTRTGPHVPRRNLGVAQLQNWKPFAKPKLKTQKIVQTQCSTRVCIGIKNPPNFKLAAPPEAGS